MDLAAATFMVAAAIATPNVMASDSERMVRSYLMTCGVRPTTNVATMTTAGKRLLLPRTRASHVHARTPRITCMPTRNASGLTNEYSNGTGHVRATGAERSRCRYPALSGNVAGWRPHTADARRTA